MLAELASVLKLPISVTEKGDIIANKIVSAKEGKDIDATNTINRILDKMESIGEATIRSGERNFEILKVEYI